MKQLTNLTATLTCDSQWIILNNATVQLPDITSGNSITQTNAFNVNILPNVPDQHIAAFTITVTDGTDTWETQRNLTINAPNVVFGNYTLFDGDGDGIYEPGETVTVTLSISNTGHMNVDSGSLAIVMNNPYAALDNYGFIHSLRLQLENGITNCFLLVYRSELSRRRNDPNWILL